MKMLLPFLVDLLQHHQHQDPYILMLHLLMHLQNQDIGKII